MVNFVLKRIVSGLMVLISVVVLICSIIYLAPVDPARLTFGQRSDNNTVIERQKELGLDLPLHQQMIRYLGDISPLVITSNQQDRFHNKGYHLSLGAFQIIIKKPYLRTSYQNGRSVYELMKESIPQTLILALAAFILATIIGIILGIIASIYHKSWLDNAILVISTVGISVPSYVASIFFALTFGYLWSSYTGLNMQGGIFEVNNIGDDVVVWKNLVLPALALGIRPISIVVQLTRNAMLDVLKANYILTAKAKGLKFVQIIYKHVIRNALNPIVTSLSGWLASMLAGAFFVEKVFNYKGVGALTINGLINYDIPVILACVLFISSVFIVINILTDIFYSLIDPKVKNQ